MAYPYQQDGYGGGYGDPYGGAPPTDSSHPSDKYFGQLFGQQQTYVVQCVDAMENHKFKFALRKPEEGVRIIDITPGGPYHRAGIPCGRLVSINNIPVYDKDTVTNEIHKLQANRVARFPVVVVPDPSLPVPPPYNPADFTDETSPYLAPTTPPVNTYGGFGGAGAGGFGGAGAGAGAGLGSPQRADETMDEFLSRKLHKVSQEYKNGQISEAQYNDIKQQILAHFQIGKNGAGAAPYQAPFEGSAGPPPGGDYSGDRRGRSGRDGGHPAGHAKSMAPHPWAETSMRRYIYLRVGPGRGYNWVSNGGVFGVVKALHCVGDWVFVRTDAGTEGYIRERHLNYLPHGPKSSQVLRSLDLLDAGGYDAEPPRLAHGEPDRDEYFDPYSGHWLPTARRPHGARPHDDRRATSLSPPRYIRRRYLSPDVHIDEDLGEDLTVGPDAPLPALPYNR